MDDNKEFEEMLKERFAKLPKVVQDAVVSAHVTEHLRSLAGNHKLHMDQWEVLEHEVQATLMGFKDADELGPNLQDKLGLAPDEAHLLAQEISHTVFEPIREQLERELEHPEAQEEKVSTLDAARTAELAGAAEKQAGPSAPTPATPPPPSPTGTAVRSADVLYISNTPSHQRASIEGDPYREQVG